MKKFVVVVLDGFGIGAMEDVPVVRPEDTGSCTLRSILKTRPDLYLPNLERLGLMNALGCESARMYFSDAAVWGRSSLMHRGADTFWGHQEIMGTLPKQPKREPFFAVADEVASVLRSAGHKVELVGFGLLVVDGALTVGDNIEADPGQNYNVTAALDKMPFDKVLEIGRLVRDVVKVSRVICFGCPGIGMDRILEAVEEKEGTYIGVNAPRSGVYREGYQCVHLGYGVNPSVQVPALLAERGVPVILFGKVADIVENPRGKSVSWVDTEEVLSMTLGAFEALSFSAEGGFICTNVQETDLAGHSQDPGRYALLLEKADLWIGRLMERMDDGDVLLVMADHGNDPCVGHSRHTREKVPILVYSRSPALIGIDLGERATLSDVGATVAACFGARPPENGRVIEQIKQAFM